MKPIRILVINPNSTASATEGILADARAFAGDAFAVDAAGNPGGPAFIDTEADREAAAPGMEKILRENEEAYDAFVVACHCDPNVPLLRSLTKKPVVGIGQASLYMAAVLSNRFAVVTTSAASAEEKREQVARYGLGDLCTGCRGSDPLPDAPPEENTMAKRMARSAVRAVREDGAEVIVPAITGFPGLSRAVAAEAGVPVLDSLAWALFLARDLAAYHHGMKEGAACGEV